MQRALPVLLVVAALASVGVAQAEPGPSGRDPRGVTDTIVRVGGLGDATLYGDAATGARARFERANGDGELPGRRTIEFVRFADDKSDAALDEAEATTLVEQDQVFAIVPAVTPALGENRLLDREQVPVIGWGIAPGFCGNDYAFGFNGCLFPPAGVAANHWAVLVERYLGDAPGTPQVAVVADDDDAGARNLETASAAAEDVGFEVVYAEQPVPATGTSDYTSVAVDIMQAGNGAPDAVFLTGAFPNVLGISAKLRELGFQGVLTNGIGYDPRLVAVQAGATALAAFAPFESAPENATMQRLIDDVRAIQPDAALTPQLAAGYFSADLFVKVARKVGKRLTPERFLEVANDGFEWRLKGTAGPTTFPRGHTEPTPCGSLVLSDGAAFAVAEPYRCGELVDS